MSALRAVALLASVLAGTSSLAQDPAALLGQMAGTWDVEQRMWTGAKAEPTALPAAVAQRQVSRGMYLQEVMQPAAGPASQAEPFVRTALLNYNPVTSRYEYTSLDTRAPQLMVEQGARAAASATDADLKLQGGTFLAPVWGAAKNVTFTYRLTIGPVKNDKQIVRLYLAPKTVLPKSEFLAFEYVYTRKT